MLIHSCITVSSLSNAQFIFESLFELPLLYTFEIEPEIIQSLFKVNLSAHARVYDTGNSRLEVFVIPEMPSPGPFQHLCLGFRDREPIIQKAVDAGFKVRRYRRPDAEVVFIVDTDGNLFELKSVPVR